MYSTLTKKYTASTRRLKTMNTPTVASIKRAGRYLFDYVLAFGLWYIACKLSSIPIPEIFQPVVAAIIAAIGKYIRDTLKLCVLF